MTLILLLKELDDVAKKKWSNETMYSLLESLADFLEMVTLFFVFLTILPSGNVRRLKQW